MAFFINIFWKQVLAYTTIYFILSLTIEMADRKEKIVMKSALKIISKSSSLTSLHILSYPPMVSNSFMENQKFGAVLKFVAKYVYKGMIFNPKSNKYIVNKNKIL